MIYFTISVLPKPISSTDESTGYSDYEDNMKEMSK